MSESYDPKKAAEEADKVRELNIAEQITSIERCDSSPGKEVEFLDELITTGITGGVIRDPHFPKDLKDKMVSAMFASSLSELKRTRDMFLQNQSKRSLHSLNMFMQHRLVKAADAIQDLDASFHDIYQDYEDCLAFGYAPYAKNAPENIRLDPYEKESDEEFLARSGAYVKEYMEKIEQVLKKYSDDERFTHDPHTLVAEIREDVAKYRQEHPKTQG